MDWRLMDWRYRRRRRRRRRRCRRHCRHHRRWSLAVATAVEVAAAAAEAAPRRRRPPTAGRPAPTAENLANRPPCPSNWAATVGRVGRPAPN